LDLKLQNFLERRLQTQIFKLGFAGTIHEARMCVKQRHMRVRNQLVDVPSFIIRTDSQKHIDFALTSPWGGGRPGRRTRIKNLRKAHDDGGKQQTEEPSEEEKKDDD